MSAPSFVKSVVRTCLGIGKKDRVVVFTWRHTLDLAEAFVIECRRAGAQVHAAFVTDEIFYDRVLNLPLEYLKIANPFDLALMDMVTVEIMITGPEDPERLKKVPVEKWTAIAKADKPFMDKFLQRRYRGAHIMLGYVTPQRARTYGFNYNSWKENVKAALDVKYENMQKLGKKLGKALEKAHEVHITTSKGTDLTLTLEDRPVHINDGVVDDEDLTKGATFVTLPSGAVQLAPTETSANGTFVSDIPEPQWGLLIHDVKWVFKEGKLMSLGGGKNSEVLRENWEKATGDKDRIGWLTLGINPKAKRGFINNQIVLGTATIGVGENRELGGKNEGKWGSSFTVTEPTVELDGKAIIKKGKLTI